MCNCSVEQLTTKKQSSFPWNSFTSLIAECKKHAALEANRPAAPSRQMCKARRQTRFLGKAHVRSGKADAHWALCESDAGESGLEPCRQVALGALI